ncbi:MAG: hypothetical protein GF368_04250 [Candidatus Aenigmarchaeota archaeon]|nr:hypothetical protein [Candidatus Aenigmarchaeota archaeon]
MKVYIWEDKLLMYREGENGPGEEIESIDIAAQRVRGLRERNPNVTCLVLYEPPEGLRGKAPGSQVIQRIRNLIRHPDSRYNRKGGRTRMLRRKWRT